MLIDTKQIAWILNKSVVSCSMPKALQTNKGRVNNEQIIKQLRKQIKRH